MTYLVADATGVVRRTFVISEHCLKRRVQFYETDAAGIVHFSCFFRYLEEAEHALWRAAGLTIASPGSEIGWPRVAASFEFMKPLHFEDEFEVRLRIVAKTKKTIHYNALVTKNGETMASGSLTITCVTRRPGEAMKAVAIPPEVDSRLQVAAQEKLNG